MFQTRIPVSLLSSWKHFKGKDNQHSTSVCDFSELFVITNERLSFHIVLDLGAFSTRTRGGVSVREGQGVVLMCTSPPHSPGKSLEIESQASFFISVDSNFYHSTHFFLLQCQGEWLPSLFIYSLLSILMIRFCSRPFSCPSIHAAQMLSVIIYSKNRARIQILRDQISWIIRTGKKCYTANYFTKTEHRDIFIGTSWISLSTVGL